MENDSLLFLSRLQFAITVMFHYIFPPLTIGMGVMLVFFEGMYLKTKNPIYESITKFWVKIFGLNFALGVASGIVMEFEFGTNWAAYSRFVGDVFGSALAAEGIFAFFLESGFLALLVFGWDRISPRMHFFSTIMVCLGSIFSSIWIVVANSWQQTPAGYHIVESTNAAGETVARAEITDFWAMVFNPSTVDRLVHVWFGALIVGGFFVMSITAYYILKGRHLEFAKKSFAVALIVAAVGSFGSLVQGHSQAVTVSGTQPAKMAAFEGQFVTGTGGSPLYIVGIPDEESQTVSGIAIPGMLSWLIHGDTDKPVTGLDKFAPEDRPPVFIPFMSYHLMVGLGMLFIALTLVGLLYLWRGKLFEQRWLLWIFVFVVIAPFIANQLGWVAAEVGRQPWIVYAPLEIDAETGNPAVDAEGRFIYVEHQGLRTANALSKVVDASQVRNSIIMFGVIYLMLFAVWVFVLNDKIHKGPEPAKVRDGVPPTTEGLLDAAASRAGHDDSMTATESPSKTDSE